MLQTQNLKLTLYVFASKQGDYPESEGWKGVSSTKKKCTIDGRDYTLVEKRERYLPLCSLERIARLVFGLFCCFLTLGIAALVSTTVRRSLSGREVVRILEPASSQKKAQQVTQQIVNPSEPSQPPFNITAYQCTSKFFSLPTLTEQPEFTPLTDQQVVELLEVQPLLKTLAAAQKTMTAYESILQIHSEGIPQKLEGIANAQLIGNMQFILYKIYQETDREKRKSLLNEVAVCVADCAAVTQGFLAKMYMKLASVGHFAEQVANFILLFKEKIANETVGMLHPEMEDLTYANKNYSNPSMQFPHMRAGYVALLGNELGLNTVGSTDDPKRNKNISKEKQDAFKALFNEKASIPELVKRIVIDINGRKGQICPEGLLSWCDPELLGEAANEFEYDKDLVYPPYSPPYKMEYGHGAYVTERFVCAMLASLGYIQLSNS